MDAGLTGKVVLVTGASGGIGAATARGFAAEGGRVVLHGHTHVDRTERLAIDVGNATVVQADLRDEEQVDRMFVEILGRVGPVDVVVVNAGIWIEHPCPLHRMSLTQWRETMDSDLTSAFLTCRAFLRQLAEHPRETASIVLVASTAALFGEEGHADYASAKAAMARGLCPSLKNEIVRLAARGRVNCVCPGWVETPMAAGSLADPRAVARATATMALRKVASPEEVALAIVFLASDRLAGHISGAILAIAGGMEGRLLHPHEEVL